MTRWLNLIAGIFCGLSVAYSSVLLIIFGYDPLRAFLTLIMATLSIVNFTIYFKCKPKSE